MVVLLALTLETPGIIAQAHNLAVPSWHSDLHFTASRWQRPLAQWRGVEATDINLGNSERLQKMVADGKLQLTLRDALALALENNLDLAIARYNQPIADTDILRTRAGGTARGVNTGVVSGTPGGGQGGFGSNAGTGAGGTSSGSGGAGSGSGGIVQSTLGSGATISSYDPQIGVQYYIDHDTQMLTNRQLYGVSSYRLNTGQLTGQYSQAFPTGTSVQLTMLGNRETTNSTYNNLSPQLYSYIRAYFEQRLLSGFGLDSNLRYLRIANNNRKISNIAFRAQAIATITQIANIYWDLAAAYDEAQVRRHSLEFARHHLELDRKQLELEAIPEIEVLKSEAEVAKREQEMTVAASALRLQELLLKNAVTRRLDDPVLEEMPVKPLDRLQEAPPDARDIQQLIAHALENRTELQESSIDLRNRDLSRRSARNALLPSLSLYGYYAGSGYSGEPNAAYGSQSGLVAPTGFGGALRNALNNTSPDYQLGVNLSIPVRNRVARADQQRTELEYRQSQLYAEELKKRIRIEVRNARYAYEQSQSRVVAARKARDLAQRELRIMQQEQALGAGSGRQTLQAEHDLALAESDVVAAETACEKARIEQLRATGDILDEYRIGVDEVSSGALIDSR